MDRYPWRRPQSGFRRQGAKNYLLPGRLQRGDFEGGEGKRRLRKPLAPRFCPASGRAGQAGRLCDRSDGETPGLSEQRRHLRALAELEKGGGFNLLNALAHDAQHLADFLEG